MLLRYGLAALIVASAADAFIVRSPVRLTALKPYRVPSTPLKSSGDAQPTTALFGCRDSLRRMLSPVNESGAGQKRQLLLSGGLPLAFLGVRTSYFFFLLFGVGLVSKVR